MTIHFTCLSKTNKLWKLLYSTFTYKWFPDWVLQTKDAAEEYRWDFLFFLLFFLKGIFVLYAVVVYKKHLMFDGCGSKPAGLDL